MRVEKQSLRGVKQIVRRATDIIAAEAARVGVASAAAAVRRQAPSTQASIGTELIQSKREARAAGRGALESELERPLRAPIHGAEDDAAAAFVAAAGITAAWGSAALQAVAAEAPLGRIASAVAPNIERTVATEVGRAFNDERDGILVNFGLDGLDGGGDEPSVTKPRGMYKVWSAVLDGKTCSRCFAADGETIELHKAFAAPGPPLHPRCRCFIEHVIVPKPERLEDIAIDYALFKEELRDVIREKRAVSASHALSFVADSMGPKRSPKVLTKRFAEERYRR